ncbi:MAG: ABC transporter permease subunit [Moorella sp. (in: Bacteria)]|nr:ABC transporter permease subunit [Moorella sp. (in: firmicutes)]
MYGGIPLKSWQDKIKAWLAWYRQQEWSSGGLQVVFFKELADNLSSIRFTILVFLVTVAGVAAFYTAAQNIHQVAGNGDAQFVFLRLFTTAGGNLPPFITFISFLGPLLGLALGFDAINGEHNRRTLSRLLAQPIYRDDVINGKFLAGLVVLAIVIIALGLLVAGLGLLLTGVPPTSEEIGRLCLYFLVTIIYVAFWLSVSLLFSLLFRQTATSALAGIALWLFCALFAGMLAGLVADGLLPAGESASPARVLHNAVLKQNLSRISPTTLYDEATITLLNPEIRTLGPIYLEQLEGAIKGVLPLGQSLLLIWPHLVGLVAATMLIFALAYYFFMRQEIRAG